MKGENNVENADNFGKSLLEVTNRLRVNYPPLIEAGLVKAQVDYPKS